MGRFAPRDIGRAALAAAVLAWGLAAVDAGAKIVYPPDNALLKGDGAVELLAFRPAAAGQGTIVVEWKGGSEKFPAAPGVVRAKVALRPGKNVLRLDAETVNVFVQETGAASAPPGFEVPGAHARDNGCEECHRIEKEQAPLLETGAKLCLRCHDDVTTSKGKTPTVHPPASEGDCAACHRLHGAAAGQLSQATGSALCLGCHQDPGKGADGKEWKVRHRALSKGCLACHAPHVSDAPHLLKSAEGALCAGRCHKDRARKPDGGAWATPHAPVAAGQCSACHGPHGAPFRFLLTRAGNAVCLGCHDKTHQTHRSVKNAARLENVVIPKPFPVNRDGEFGCGGCHVPHGSDNKKLWLRNEKQLCPLCHTTL